MFQKVLLVAMLLMAFQIPALLLAQEQPKPAFEPKGKVSGYAFGDWFYNAENADTAKKSLNAFQFRRIYLYYDYEWSETFAAQYLLEADSKEATSGGKIGVFVKSAYLEWKELVPKASLYIGLSATPTWSTHSEKVWSYRSIDKTILDLRGLGLASDIGLGLKGKFDEAGKVLYHVMIGNGKGQKPEDNRYKKAYGYVIFKPSKELAFEVYADYEGAPKYSNSDRRKDVFTVKGFAAYQGPNVTVGIEAFSQNKNNSRIDGVDTLGVTPIGVTFFVHGTLRKDQLKAFARFDLYDSDSKREQASENYIIAGLDYLPQKNIHIMPNILVNDYTGKDNGYDEKASDITARVTFLYTYK